MYSQTTGPRDNPKSAMYTIKPPTIITLAIVVAVPSSPYPLTINPIPIKNNDTIAMSVPICNINFLPSFIKRPLVNKDVKVC